MPAANDFGQKAMVVAAMAVSKATTLMKAVPGRWKPKKSHDQAALRAKGQRRCRLGLATLSTPPRPSRRWRSGAEDDVKPKPAIHDAQESQSTDDLSFPGGDEAHDDGRGDGDEEQIGFEG